MKSKEQLFDENTDVQFSDISLDSGTTSGDLGLGEYALKSLYSDFILAEYIDMSKGFEEQGGLVVVDTKTKSWRKAVVRMVSDFMYFGKDGKLYPMVSATKVGDIITFPNDKGLVSGRIAYVDENGERKICENGVFLNERRIFGKLETP